MGVKGDSTKGLMAKRGKEKRDKEKRS